MDFFFVRYNQEMYLKFTNWVTAKKKERKKQQPLKQT